MKKRITVSLLFMLMLLIFPNATQGALDVKNKTSNESVTTHQKLKENSKTKKRNFRKWLKRNFSKIKFKRKRKTETDIIIKRKANISLILAMLSIGLPLLYFFFGSLFLIISPIVLSLLGVHLSKQTLKDIYENGASDYVKEKRKARWARYISIFAAVILISAVSIASFAYMINSTLGGQ